MSSQQRHFSRRFLTILIVICSIAIILLSQSEQSEDGMLPPSNISPQLIQP